MRLFRTITANPAFLGLALLVLLQAAMAAPAFSGCYDDRIGDEFTLALGEEFCLKNTKWNCKPLCYYYAGMPAPKAYSLGVSKHQGALNLFYHLQDGEEPIFVINNNHFTVLELHPEYIRVRYQGE